MRLKRDPVVNACIDSKIERESTWKRKSSTAVKCDHLVAPVVENSLRPATSQVFTNSQSTNRAKGALKKTINEEIKIKWNARVQKLTMQGDFVNLLIEEEESVTWQSIARKMPRNVMSFAARLASNTLASPDNLKRWGKRKFGNCPLCSSRSCTLAHITNMCPVSLRQGRYTWRHNSVLQQITKVVKNFVTPNTEVFSDIEGHQVNGGTIPADVLVTGGQGSKPDLVIINRTDKKIALLELTCSHFSSANKAHQKKLGDYTQLSLDLSAKGFSVVLMPFEVLSSGHVTNRTRTNIRNTLRLFNMNPRKDLFENMAKISLLCTMSIFYAYQVNEWIDPPLLSP